jgi:hypothetical protein
MPARSGWRPINQTKGRKRKKQEGPLPGPIPGPIHGPTGAPEPRHAGPPPDLRQQVTGSWATWQRQYFLLLTRNFEVNIKVTADPALVPTPPSIEPTLLVPPQGSPGLFGPRSQRSSFMAQG